MRAEHFARVVAFYEREAVELEKEGEHEAARMYRNAAASIGRARLRDAWAPGTVRMGVDHGTE
jgi:hypothetical protein